MKQITKVEDLVAGAIYWVKLKNNDRTPVEPAICSISRNRHYFVFPNDIDVNKDVNSHEAHSVLEYHFVVGPVSTPEVTDFNKYLEEGKQDETNT